VLKFVTHLALIIAVELKPQVANLKKISHIIIEEAVEYLRVLSMALVVLDAMAFWQLRFVEPCFDRF